MRRKRFHRDHTPGAFYVTWNTGSCDPYYWPAKRGIEKCKGSVIFYPVSSYDHRKDIQKAMTPNICERKFCDVPTKGQAWLVKPFKDHWLWERVDDQLVLIK